MTATSWVMLHLCVWSSSCTVQSSASQKVMENIFLKNLAESFLFKILENLFHSFSITLSPPTFQRSVPGFLFSTLLNLHSWAGSSVARLRFLTGTCFWKHEKAMLQTPQSQATNWLRKPCRKKKKRVYQKLHRLRNMWRLVLGLIMKLTKLSVSWKQRLHWFSCTFTSWLSRKSQIPAKPGNRIWI